VGFRVFKTTYKDRKGRRKEAAAWYVEFRDQLDIVRRLPAFTSKAASEEMGRNLVKLVAYHKASGGQTDPALTRFLTGLPAKLREKLVSIGLLAADRVATAKPLSEHLDDFALALTAKGNSPFHVETVTGRARRVLVDGCGYRFYGDISASRVMQHLHTLRAGNGTKPGISAQTFNFYLGAVKQFCRWMLKDRRAVESPVAHLSGLNVKTDRRRDRRAFTVPELVGLLDTTAGASDRYGMAGTDRAMLYRLAVETGLRSGELRSLTRACFALGGESPTVTVEAAYSKHRRQDTLPLRPALAAELRTFLAMLAPGAPVFRIPTDHHDAADMFREDVEAAGIAYRDDTGRVADFHSLRHTFITNLANGGVHPKVAQALARHSTITLTMDRYSHTLFGEQAEALDVLPDLASARQQTRATGTDGESVLASCLALSARPSAAPGDTARQLVRERDDDASATEATENTRKHANSQETGVYGNRTHSEPCSNPPLVLKTRAPTRGANTPRGRKSRGNHGFSAAFALYGLPARLSIRVHKSPYRAIRKRQSPRLGLRDRT
jgi:integrase